MARQGCTHRLKASLTLLLGLLIGAANAEIYQWRDADGKLHFGDAPPDRQEAEDLSERYDNRLPFQVIIEGVDYRIPPSVRNHINVSVRKIFAIYEQALGVELNQEQDFRIVIYGTEAAFRQYQRQVAPVLENASGFYNGSTNQITTWGMPEPQLLAVITHEASHAISASEGRWIPTWLNEGLAEYFEGMRVSGLGAEVYTQRYWLTRLKTAGYHQQDPQLQRYLTVDHEGWYQADGGDGALSYATSWSLVFFLMDSDEGRELLKQVLNRARLTPMPLRDSAGYIARRWPGGLAALTEAWQQWLAGVEQDRHRF